MRGRVLSNRKSPWPEVWEIMAPEGKMRGPAPAAVHGPWSPKNGSDRSAHGGEAGISARRPSPATRWKNACPGAEPQTWLTLTKGRVQMQSYQTPDSQRARRSL